MSVGFGRRFLYAMKGGLHMDKNINPTADFEIEGIPEEKQEDGIFALDGKGRPIRLEVPDDDD